MFFFEPYIHKILVSCWAFLTREKQEKFTVFLNVHFLGSSIRGLDHVVTCLQYKKQIIHTVIHSYSLQECLLAGSMNLKNNNNKSN